jgi:zinc protease
MINPKSFILDNGPRVIVHENPGSAIAAVNIMCDASSRDEAPNRTGFTHLLEYLVSGGVRPYSACDKVLQQVDRDHNLHTLGVTSCYCTLTAANFSNCLLA